MCIYFYPVDRTCSSTCVQNGSQNLILQNTLFFISSDNISCPFYCFELCSAFYLLSCMHRIRSGYRNLPPVLTMKYRSMRSIEIKLCERLLSTLFVPSRLLHRPVIGVPARPTEQSLRSINVWCTCGGVKLRDTIQYSRTLQNYL